MHLLYNLSKQLKLDVFVREFRKIPLPAEKKPKFLSNLKKDIFFSTT